ncbi:putative nucleotide-diphospho-sugar transferase [Clostridium sp. 'White wine YQ']|uniref:putative nucleotide-diphospho-sugar transferase n=1 Tax=Clostridium sp. 'White wine YQ' TaxID=3027474 RepID=UPI002367212C|nr:putative nucleotide-diphospho-sugar transferase [Clostridium sp. 'White wine YQ']MDD7793360.1 putative nucleotide-diphospho-sugar transferase [Clostridium sp. 'White wine YQ']
MLCIDDETYSLLSKINFNHVILITLNELKDDSIIKLRKERKLNEFCWTLKPIFIESLLCNYYSLERITFIDSDLYFFSNPTIIFENQPTSSVLLSCSDVYVPSFSPIINGLVEDLTGKYNSGFISFKNDLTSKLFLKSWKVKCIERCSDNIDNNSFGDQKYLDTLPYTFENISSISTPGVNIGHWNYARYKFHILDGMCFIDKSKLICYHFSGFRIVSKTQIFQLYEFNRIDFPFIYSFYKNVIKDIIVDIEQIDPYFNGFSTEGNMSTCIIKLNKP